MSKRATHSGGSCSCWTSWAEGQLKPPAHALLNLTGASPSRQPR
ncbi:TPA: hypothetical protein ACGOR9_002225 [Streptococcus suis]